MSGADRICLSIILRIVGGPQFAQRCLSCLVPQTVLYSAEIILPFDSTVSGMDELKRDFPQVIFHDMGCVRIAGGFDSHAMAHDLYDRRTAAGLKIAQGEIMALLEDYGVPDPDWCEQIIKAHRLPHGVIGGTVEHSGKGSLNWAVYFLDFGRYQLPIREGPANYLTDVNVSYKRKALQSVRDLWCVSYNEVTVNWALAKKGIVLWQKPEIVVREDRGKLSFWGLIEERFSWGRLFACKRVESVSILSRVLYVVLSPAIPAVLLARMAIKVLRARRNWVPFVRALPLVVVLTLVWCIGEFIGYVTARTDTGHSLKS
jgi:hypothetical protein